MYTARTGFILGFHGTDQTVVNKVLQGSDLTFNENPYDWLGNGIYFWDNSPSRAFEWAKELSEKPNSKIKNPAVIGAIIDLGYCLDLLDYKNLDLVKSAYGILQSILEKTNIPFPENTGTKDLLRRELDYAVIEILHQSMKATHQEPFDSVRGVFWEGDPLYPQAGFKEKDHIQICVRNIDCIKGYFLPLPRVNS